MTGNWQTSFLWGPLSNEAVEEIVGLWDVVKDDPPVEHRTLIEELLKSTDMKF